MKWRVVLEQDIETGGWAVLCPELPGCTSAGETEDEAMANTREAIELYREPDVYPLAPTAVVREVFVYWAKRFASLPRAKMSDCRLAADL